MTFSNQELEEFKAEATELLEAAERSLLEADSCQDFNAWFDGVFRCFHNLKGAAGMMEMNDLQKLTHDLESHFLKFKGNGPVPAVDVNAFLKGVDAAKAIIAGNFGNFDFNSELNKTGMQESTPTPNNGKSQETPNLNDFHNEADEILQRLDDILSKLTIGTIETSLIDNCYREFHTLKGLCFLFNFSKSGEIAHQLESHLQEFRDNSKKELSREKLSHIKELFHDLEISLDDKATENNNTSVDKPLQNSNQNNKKSTTNSSESDQSDSSSIRVSVSLLDNLMTLIGEMVLVRNQVLQISNMTDNLEFNNLSKRLNVVTGEIQNSMMKTRMQPVGNVLGKFNRVVRDLSRELGKEIKITLTGAATELDRSMLESIKDPLTHIIRNSCDHGIEKPDARLAAGKPREGNIYIDAFHEGGQIIIKISDDGKGLDRTAIIQKAVTQGLLLNTQANTMSEKEIYNLIFAPGFSTAQSVTNVSGRGVGMDVVRSNIEKIGGTVDLTSKEGAGTTILLKIPLTLAIIPALLVTCGESNFAIPQVKLEELVRFDDSEGAEKLEFISNTPLCRLRGKILPLIDLKKQLGMKSQEADLARTNTTIAVVNSDLGRFGLMVDDILDTADIVVKPLNRLLKSLNTYAGATILGDGSIALILDINGIARHCRFENAEQKSDRTTEKVRLNDLQDFLVFQVNSPTRHAIALNYVHRLEEFSLEKVEYTGKKKVIRYGEKILPLISINEILSLPSSEAILDTKDTSGDKAEGHTQEMLSVVVVARGGNLYGLIVNRIVDTLSTDSDIDSNISSENGVFGNLNLQNELIVVVDPFSIIDRYNDGANVVSLRSNNSTLSREFHSQNLNTGLKILFVEDTSYFRKTITKILEGAGHHVTIAQDGEEAMKILQNEKHSFDLIVSDIEMPRMNGFELAKNIRNGKGSFSTIPMLALSSRADKSYTQKGIESGFDLYMEKLRPDVLLEQVHHLVNARRKTA